MQTPMMSYHLIPTWHKWNMNTGDIMVVVCIICKPCDIMLGMSCACMHGACALTKNDAPKYPSGLVFTQADLNLGKITASHFQVLNTQNFK